jgi:hypothetical protein
MPDSSHHNHKLFPFKFHITDALIKTCPVPETHIHVKNKNTITFKASNVTTLTNYLKEYSKHATAAATATAATIDPNHLDTEIILHMINNIGTQLDALTEMKKGIPYFTLDDIYVITISTDTATATAAPTSNDHPPYFCIMNETKVYDMVSQSSNLDITTPPVETGIKFLTPEMPDPSSQPITLPLQINYKSAFYSFALLCIHCFVNKSKINPSTNPSTKQLITSNNHHNMTPPTNKKQEQPQQQQQHSQHSTHDETLLDESLNPIMGTNIYWFIKRATHPTPEKRRFILI